MAKQKTLLKQKVGPMREKNEFSIYKSKRANRPQKSTKIAKVPTSTKLRKNSLILMKGGARLVGKLEKTRKSIMGPRRNTNKLELVQM